MKLNERFMPYETDGEKMLVTTGGKGFNGLIRSTNKTAAFILECLKTDTTEEEILDKMTEHFNAPREVIAADLSKLLAELVKIGAITE